jgi:ketosteroid isomerase-like protein
MPYRPTYSRPERKSVTPRQVVEEFVKRFNAGDASALAELYHEDAVNHQVTQEPVQGRTSIRQMFEREFATANMICIPEIIHEAGAVAILEWRDPIGVRGCGFFTVRDGRIIFQRGYWDKLSFLRLHGLPID